MAHTWYFSKDIHGECFVVYADSPQGSRKYWFRTATGRFVDVVNGGKGRTYEHSFPPGETVAGMPGDLQNELPVPAFVQEATGRRPLHWEATKDKRAGGEAEVLPGGFTLESDALDGLDLAHLPLGDDEVWMGIR